MSTSLAVFIITVVAIGCGAGIIRDYLKTRRKELEAGGNAREYEARIDALEERIQVLERIVTEKNVDLKQQINQL
ncbi:MAG: hypothetical protein AAFX10_12395 [Pseudomonadota bacterium]